MTEEEFRENINAVKEILKGLDIPGKKDSMLAAAKAEHIERLGEVLFSILEKTKLTEEEIKEVLNEFKEQYRNTFLKFITKEG